MTVYDVQVFYSPEEGRWVLLATHLTLQGVRPDRRRVYRTRRAAERNAARIRRYGLTPPS